MSSFVRNGRYTVRAAALAVLCLALPAQASELKDPTRPPAEQLRQQGPAVGEISYRLESVLAGADRKLAIINGKRVAEGGRIDGARVLRIEPGSVLISSQGEQRRLVIKSPQVKKRLKQDN